jgi:hypothetical protein
MALLKIRRTLVHAAAILISVWLTSPLKAQQQADSLIGQSFDTETVNIYCTSNQDGTGACINAATSAPFDCTLIPGQVISCRDGDMKKYSCINYGSNQSGQGNFQCTPKPKLSLNETPPGSSF